MVDQILLINKPAGITSFDVIRQLRKVTGFKKFGHAGTLDPLATGLMVVGAGAGTKRLNEYIKLDKEYVAEILLGQQRVTGDMEGDVLAEQPVTQPVEASLLTTTLRGMLGTLTLPVSAYSAIKKDGVPMYKRARKAEKVGEVVTDVPLREMRVMAAVYEGTNGIEIDGKPFQLVTVRFTVGSGTYIRSLAEEFGRRLGFPATLYHLERTRVGEFRLEDAILIDEVQIEPIA